MVAHRESAKVAQRFIHETCAPQGIGRNQLTIHGDRGPAMTPKPVAFLLANLITLDIDDDGDVQIQVVQEYEA